MWSEVAMNFGWLSQQNTFVDLCHSNPTAGTCWFLPIEMFEKYVRCDSNVVNTNWMRWDTKCCISKGKTYSILPKYIVALSLVLQTNYLHHLKDQRGYFFTWLILNLRQIYWSQSPENIAKEIIHGCCFLFSWLSISVRASCMIIQFPRAAHMPNF